MKKVAYLVGFFLLVTGCDTITGPLEERIDDLEAETLRLQEQIDSLKVLTATVLELQSQTQDLQDQIDSLQAGQEDLFEMVALIELEIARLTADLTLLTQDVDSTDAELLAMIESLQTELAELEAEFASIVTIDIGIVAYSHYPDEDEWMLFENEVLQKDSSFVEVQFKSPNGTHFLPYNLVYVSSSQEFYYTVNVGDGYIWFRDSEYAHKVGWEYKLVIVNP